MALNIRKTYKKIMSIDMSSNSIAYFITDAGDVVEYGEIFFKRGNATKRLQYAAGVILSLKQDHQDLDAVVIEDAIKVHSIKTGILLGKFVGLASGILSLGGADIVEVPPISWQTHIGNPNLSKAERQQMKLDFPNKSIMWYKEKGREMRKQKTLDIVNERFDLALESDNVGDAAGINIYATDTYGIADK